MKRNIALLLIITTFFSLLSFTGCRNETAGNTLPATVPGPTSPTEPAPTEPTVPEGKNIGDACISFDLQVVDENGATGETVNPAKISNVTVLNFWGVWCNPCVSELPHFNQITREYDVTVIAVHSRNQKEDMPRFILNNYPNSPMIFAWDQTGNHEDQDDYYAAMCNSANFGSYPYTVIINAQGIITHIIDGNISYEALVKAVEEAGAGKKELKIVPEAAAAVDSFFDLALKGNTEKLETVIPETVWNGNFADLSLTEMKEIFPEFQFELLADEFKTYGNKLYYSVKVTDCVMLQDEVLETYQQALQTQYGIAPENVPYGVYLTLNLSISGSKKAKTFMDMCFPVLCIDGGWYVASEDLNAEKILVGADLVESMKDYMEK